ncbi:uncharacterized protein IL334_005776 [Kwoniella shivajii]|uniref:FAD-binding domain-containing protein n=1 Tax=Kwoniella shivajii TaxID=564305 RepID=A0ABZ1D756_9TREE|nr:hypothetical protein IL334_005776 [Kwoniella shivajii]
MAIPKHVLIVGAGLGGPCLALSLARQKISSTIIEIRHGISESGGSLSLGADALRVLDRSVGVYDRVRAAGFVYHRIGAYLEDGHKLGEVVAGEDTDQGYPAVRIMRPTLHKLLIEASQAAGDFVKIKWSGSISTIDEDDTGITARFDDGTEIRGDILIGADGIHSQVRKHVLGSASPIPLFTNTCVINGFLPRSSAKIPSSNFTFPAIMFTPAGVFMTIPIDPEGKTLAWGVTTSEKERTRKEWSEFELSGDALRMARAECSDIQLEPVRSLLDNAVESEARVWPAYSIFTLPTWHTSRICLIGDAAHALPPNGQGSAMAFQDAALLGRMIASKSASTSYDQVFTRFEALRRPEIEKVEKSAKPVSSLKTKSGPWIWYLKSWAFWGFFKFKGGVLRMHNGPIYDVDAVDLGKL